MFLEKICPKVMILPHVLSWQKKERLVMALRKHRRFGMLQNQLSRSENIEIRKKCSQS